MTAQSPILQTEPPSGDTLSERAAALIDGGGGRYVEGAVMTSVPPYRIKVPLLLGGAGARELAPLLNELGFNSDWIEKCLAHEDGRSSRGVYNKAEYELQRRHMMQEWSNIIDAWVGGQKYAPTLIPPSMPIFEPDPAL